MRASEFFQEQQHSKCGQKIIFYWVYLFWKVNSSPWIDKANAYICLVSRVHLF